MESNEEKNERGMSRRSFLRLTALSGSVAFVAACAAPAAPTTGGGDAEPAEAPAESAPAAEPGGPQYGGTMVLMGHQEVAGLSPDDIGPTVQAVMIRNILDSLVYYDEFTDLKMVLAESVDVAPDGSQYTFNLHEGVMFHDGTEMTSEDVKYTYDYYRNPDNGASIAGNFNGIGSIDTPDPYTVVVNMDEINAASLSNWASIPIVHSRYHAEVGEDTFRTAPIGTGAFKVKEWRAAEFTELEAFEDHFRGRPYLDILREDIVPEPSVRMIALQTGEADSAVWPLLVEDSILLEGDPGYVVYRTLANSVKHFPLNNTLPQLAQKEVRQALLMGLDRQRIIDDLWNGAAQVAHSNLAPKNAFYYNSDTQQYDFNPEEAVALLEGAGWTVGADGTREKDGERLTFTCTTITGDQARRPIAELAQQMLVDIGVDMQLAEAPVAAILEQMRNQTMDCSLFNWTYGSTPEPDPFQTLHVDGGNNFTGYNNPRMNELIDQGVQIVDPNERQPIYHEIQDIFVEDVPALYLQFDEWMNVFSSRVKGLPENPLSGDPIYYAANTLWIDES